MRIRRSTDDPHRVAHRGRIFNVVIVSIFRVGVVPRFDGVQACLDHQHELCIDSLLTVLLYQSIHLLGCCLQIQAEASIQVTRSTDETEMGVVSVVWWALGVEW